MIVINGAQRGSGNQLSIAVFKQGPQMLKQAEIMQHTPRTYTPVLATCREGYAMPVLTPLQDAAQVGRALALLEDLWLQPATPWRTHMSRAEYYDYVQRCPTDMILLSAARRWYERARGQAGAPVSNIHGDATLENAMLYERQVVWIDPDVRATPLEAENDAGKVLQSVYGYSAIPVGGIRVALDWLAQRRLNAALVKFYFASHLVRLWRHQPAHHSWAISIAREVLGA